MRKPINIGSLFVPFAIRGSMPNNIITGSVMADPLLAMVLMNPDRIPTVMNIVISNRGIFSAGKKNIEVSYSDCPTNIHS